MIGVSYIERLAVIRQSITHLHLPTSTISPFEKRLRRDSICVSETHVSLTSDISSLKQQTMKNSTGLV